MASIEIEVGIVLRIVVARRNMYQIEKRSNLLIHYKKLLTYMHGGGSRVRTIMMDMEFKKVKDQEGMELVDINTTVAYQHVGEIERGIWYLKERSRFSVSTFAVAGIKYLAKPIVICLVYNVTLFVNATLDTLGFSERYSPQKKIVTQLKFDFKQDYKFQCCAYVQASNEVIVTTMVRLCTHGCVALRTSENWQGSAMCFNPDTGKFMIHRVIEEMT